MARLAFSSDIVMPEETDWENDVVSVTSTRIDTRDPEDGQVVSFLGSGIAFNAAGDITAGMITRVEASFDGTTFATLDHDPISGVELAELLGTGGFFAYFQRTLQGNDEIDAENQEPNYLIGFGGDDLIDGSGGDDTLDGDYVGEAAFGNDTVEGGDGNDTIRGLGGNDQVYGGINDDDVNGNMGVDTVYGGAGNDLVRGGQGDDVVYGEDGNDPHVNGNVGNDTVYGGLGNDILFGGQNNDLLVGEAGGDVLGGDLGNDTLTGGLGGDRFMIFANGGQDTVTDFSFATGDRVLLQTGTAYTVTSANGSAVVNVGAASLTLTGVAAADVQSSWVIFF